MASLKIVIIGGVAGGATAAARARRLDENADIVVLERGPDVSFANCGLPYHIGETIPKRKSLLLQTPKSLRATYRLDVRVRSEVTSIDRDRKLVHVKDLATGRDYTETYDKLLISTGAGALRPPLPGIDHPRIFSLRDLPDMDAIKTVVDDGAQRAVIVGGGFIGLEMAENLRRRGLDVDLVEMLDQVMPPLDREMAEPIQQALKLNGVRLHLGDAVESFADADGAVTANLKSGAAMTADLLILAIGVRPESKLAKDAGLELGERGGILVDESMRTTDPDIYAAGDAVHVKDFVTQAQTLIPLAGPANRQGRIAADNMLGRDSKFRGTQGTSILGLFGLTAGMTGASEKVLRRADIDYEKVYVHPMHHVGYYPGATPMVIKLLFAKADGRVLGGQIVGAEGVDRRVDVLAMAIQAGQTVFDLEEAELAYAPQFGAAKDAINMAGFAAANVLRGDTKICHADDLPDGVLLDVRPKAEHDVGIIPGTIHIPFDELRERHGELPSGKPIVVYCTAGLRGYVSGRILRQLGYDVCNVSGGFKTYRAFHPAATDADSPCAGGATSGGNETAGRSGSHGDGPSAPSAGTPSPAATTTLDVRGRQCPGPLLEMSQAVAKLADGETLKVLASDPGFVADAPAWCRQTGNELLGVGMEDRHYAATIRKAAAGPAESGSQASACSNAADALDKTIVVFSGDLDRVLAAFIIANGAVAAGRKVTLFFTFWGLNALRRDVAPPVRKAFVDRMFGWMMPRGAKRLRLSQMHMAGMGTAMMRGVMRKKNVDSLSALMAMAQKSGVRLIACSMSMDVMGIHRDELIDGVDIGGVGTYLSAADEANVNLFI